MTDAAQPTIIREPPATLVQAGGKVAEGVITGLSGTPSLLLIVILNIAMIVMAGLFLMKQEETRSRQLDHFADLIKACILETTPIGRDAPRLSEPH